VYSNDFLDFEPFGTSIVPPSGRLTLGSLWGQPDVVLAIQMLLEEATITSEEFNEVRDQVLIALSQMTGTADKVVKAILKRLTQCESALAKGRESRARQHLHAIVGLFEKAST